MNTGQHAAGTARCWRLLPLLGVALGAAWLIQAPEADAGPKASKAWKKMAKNLRTSVLAEAKADYALAQARAILIADEDDQDEYLDEAKEEFAETKSLAKEQYVARLELAEDLEEDEPYSVVIDPNDFVEGINHTFMPFTPGNTWTYMGETEDGLETIVVAVTSNTVEIMGVTCIEVRDTVTIDGELVEDTLDWFAQDVQGNVWYFGEISLNYEDGNIADVDGSWRGGVDGALPGIVMPAVPVEGDMYRTEFFLGEAEDFIEILGLNESASVPYGDFGNCMKSFDGTPMEPDVEEFKYYAPGLGLVLEESPGEGERIELISFTTDE